MNSPRHFPRSASSLVRALIASAALAIAFQASLAADLVLEARRVGQWPPSLEIPVWRLAVDQGRVFSLRLQGTFSCLGLDADGAPVEQGRLEVPAILWDLDVEGDLALVTVAYLGQLLVLDVRDPARPQFIATHTPSNPPRLVRLRGQRAFVLAQDGTLDILDLQDPLHPVTLGSLPTLASDAVDLLVTDDDAWAVSNMVLPPANLRRIDVRNPAAPIDRTPPDLPGLGRIDSGVMLQGPLLYGTSQLPGGFHVVDLQDPDQPSLIHTVPIPAGPRRFALAPTTAAVLAGGGVQVLDLSDPREPRPLGTVVIPGDAADIQWDGARYWIAGDFGITVFDPARHPSLPADPGLSSPREPGAVDVADDLAAVASGDLGVTFFDVSRPERPQLLSVVPIARARDVRLVGPWAHVAAAAVPGFTLIDVRDPRNPVTVARAVDAPVHGLDVRGTHVLLGMLHGGLRVLDVSRPEVPREVASVSTRFSTNRIRIIDDLAWVSESGGVEMYDVREPSLPRWLGRYETSEPVADLDAIGSLAFLAMGQAGLRLVDIGQPAYPLPLWSATEATPVAAVRVSSSLAVAIGHTHRNRLLAVPLGTPGDYQVASRDFTTPGFQGLALQGSRAFLVDGPIGLRILDLRWVRLQSITLPSPAEMFLGDPPFELRPTASSGLPVTLSVVSGPARLEGNLLVPTGAGRITVSAEQSGNDEWQRTSLLVSIPIRARPQTITWTQAPADPLRVGHTYRVEAVASSGLPVVLSVIAGQARLSGNELTPNRHGELKLLATQSGDESWALTYQTRNFQVGRTQTITWIDRPPDTVRMFLETPTGVYSYPLRAEASSGLPVTFSVMTGPALLNGNELFPIGLGDVTIRAEQAGDDLWQPVELSLSITIVVGEGQRLTWIEIPTGPFEIGRTYRIEVVASSGLPVTLSVIRGPGILTGNELLITGYGTIDIFARQEGDDVLLPVTGQLPLFVRKSSEIVWIEVPPDPLRVGQAYPLRAITSCGLPVTLSLISGSATVSGSQVLATDRGTVVFRASHDGDEVCEPVSEVLTYTVRGAEQTLTWAPTLPAQLRVGESYAVEAIVSSGLPVHFAISSGLATLDGNILRPSLRGTLVVSGEQAGDSHWEPIRQSREFEVVGPPQTFFVRQDSPNPAPPYASWDTAAHTLQDAIVFTASDDTVLVTNGVYRTGSAASPEGENRVSIPAGVTVRSVHGPEVTVIEGAPSGIRCAQLADGAVLSGFTLRLGWAETGGGVFCASAHSLVAHCILTDNRATNHGGGAAGGTLQGCTLSDNHAPVGGGAIGSVLEDCVLTGNSAERAGGAAFDATLLHCVVDGNSAPAGGGAYLGYLERCTLTGNSARNRGGGVISSRLYQCSVTGNTAAEGGGVAGQWVEIPGLDFQVPAPTHVFNGIVVGNTAASPVHANHAMAQFTHSCTSPHPGGVGNLDADPRLLTASHLAPDSPCLAAGHPDHAIGHDLDGDPWALPPPMGADQPQSSGPLSIRILAETLEARTEDVLRFVALAEGALTRTEWDFGDGVTLTNPPTAVHAWIGGGTYTVTLTGYNDILPDGVQDRVQVTITEVSPQPRISEPLVPSAAAPYGPAFVLTVHGTGFTPSSVVAWNDQPRQTTYLDPSRLTVVIDAADIARPGTARVTVIHPGDHRASEPVLFPVANPLPSVLTRRTDYAAPPDIIDLVAADLNGDGFTDLVQANWHTSAVTILMGMGDGTFQPGETYSACGAHGLAVGDFNQDGFKDLVVAERACGSILMLLGRGDGTFSDAGRWNVPTHGQYGPFAVLADDFDRDGLLDGVSSNEGGASLTVFLGQGEGSFRSQRDIPLGRICRNMAGGDFNHDGFADVAVVTEDGHLLVLLGVGDGTFLPPVDYDLEAGWSIVVAAADLNRDGWLDLAASAGDDALYLLFGNGDGTFRRGGHWPIGVIPFSIACGDLNADGRLDLALGTAIHNTLALLLGNGDGTFAEPVQFPGPPNPRGIAVGDFNADGRLDVALGSQGNSTLSIHLQTPASFLPPIPTGEWMLIRWNDSANGLQLQHSPTLNPPQWTDVPGTQDVTGILISPSHACGFFRLVQP